MALVKLLSPMVHDGANVKVGATIELDNEQAEYLVSVEAAVIIDDAEAVEDAPKAKK